MPVERPLGYKQHALGLDIDCQDYWYAVHNDNTSTDTVIYLPSDLPTLYYVMSLAWTREWFSFHRQLSSPRIYIYDFKLHFVHHLKNGWTGQEGTQGRTTGKDTFWAPEVHVWWFPLNYCNNSLMVSKYTMIFLFCSYSFSHLQQTVVTALSNIRLCRLQSSTPNPYLFFNFVNATPNLKSLSTKFQNISLDILLPGLTWRFIDCFVFLLSFWRQLLCNYLQPCRIFFAELENNLPPGLQNARERMKLTGWDDITSHLARK
jgi:hypothetical protein